MQNKQAIFESLFSRNFSDTDNHDFLKEITNEHPYFSPAQFYLLQQTDPGTDAFGIQAVKTNILFNNPHWLYFQLLQTGAHAPVEKTISLAETTTVAPVVAAGSFGEFIDEVPDIVVADELPDIIPSDEKRDIVVENELPDIIPADEKRDIVVADEEQEIVVSDELLEIIPQDEEREIIVADELPDNTEQTEEANMETEIEPMRIELKMPEEKNRLHEDMLFEPMHMVDYFASQGIKLTDEVQMADKLGKQLKSFTEWLKTMKKVHVENEAQTVATDTSIQTMAQNSNAETEVLTESMAEVLARQGKMDKASEVYQKLSLLNPAKSTYFAAKIENLKGI
jgi:hypothetical protein